MEMREVRTAELSHVCRVCGRTLAPQLMVCLFTRESETVPWVVSGWECPHHARFACLEPKQELPEVLADIAATGLAETAPRSAQTVLINQDRPEPTTQPDNETRLSTLILSIVDAESLSDSLNGATEEDDSGRSFTDMKWVARWLADYLAQELDQKGAVIGPLSTLLLQSEDGQGYAKPIQYPSEWGPAHAHDQAVAAFTDAQRARPDEWCWDEDCEPALTRRGFVIPCWTAGPTWDRAR